MDELIKSPSELTFVLPNGTKSHTFPSGSGGIEEAPDDGAWYSRVSKSWRRIPAPISETGRSWKVNTATGLPTNQWNAVTFGNGVFVAVSRTGSGNRAATSTNGINWTTRQTPSNEEWGDVIYANSLFVAMAKPMNQFQEPAIMTSPDGVTWTLQNTTPAPFYLSTIAYGAGLFVALAANGTDPQFITSPDASTWTLRSGIPIRPSAVIYENGLFVAVGGQGTGSATQKIATSTDGLTWTARTVPSAISGNLGSVAYINGLFIATSGTNLITSTDGATWTLRSVLPMSAHGNMIKANGILVGNNGTDVSPGLRISTSIDGVNWDFHHLEFSNYLRQMAYGNGLFVIVTGWSDVITSA